MFKTAVRLLLVAGAAALIAGCASTDFSGKDEAKKPTTTAPTASTTPASPTNIWRGQTPRGYGFNS